MKNFFSLLFLFFAATVFSQNNSVKQYVLLEHFTNSNCGICASRNPAFYNTIDDYPSDIHHISIHPPVPYVNCVFYQANTVDNTARQQFYNIQGTPRVALNGNLLAGSNPLLPVNTLTAALNKTSPLLVQVQESGTSLTRSAVVTLRAYDDIPAGTYNLHVAVVEKVVNMTTGNGESIHHDVLRDLLTPSAGQTITLPAKNQEISFDFSFDIANGWKVNEIYVLAYVQEMISKNVLNSGTKFDPLISSTDNLTERALQLFPNPVTNQVQAQTGTRTPLKVSVIDPSGRHLDLPFENSGTQTTVKTENLPAGIYYLQILTNKERLTAKMVKL